MLIDGLEHLTFYISPGGHGFFGAKRYCNLYVRCIQFEQKARRAPSADK